MSMMLLLAAPAALVALAALAARGAASAPATPPNFVVLFADDLGYGDVSWSGHPSIATPQLRRMAAEGMRFTQWLSGYQICSPSRAALLTGRLPVRSGIYNDAPFPLADLLRVFFPVSTGGLPPSERTLPELLRARGYRSKLVGKWHLGHYNGSLPTEAGGFDEFFGLPYSQWDGCPPGVGMRCHDNAMRWFFPPTPLMCARRADGPGTTRILEAPVNLQNAAPPVEPLVPRYTASALDFMRRMAAARTPFFLQLAYDEVHVPLFASPPFRNTSARGLFGDAVAEMDDSIGRVLAHIRATPALANNTLVVFTSDNGPWLMQALDGGSAGPFRDGKGSTWEGGLRVPAVAWWPGVVAANALNTRAIASTMDIAPTLVELAGGAMPTDRVVDGRSLTALLRAGDDHAAPRRYAHRENYFYYRGKQLYAVRHRQYKLHYVTRPGFGEVPAVHHDPPLVYDVEADPGEQFLLDTAHHRALIKRVADIRDAHLRAMRYGAPQLDGVDPDVYPCCDRDTKCFCEPRDSSPTCM